MNSRTILILILSVLLGCVFISSAVAQQDGYPRYTPERVERKTEAGDDGKLKWAKYEAEKCRGCSGTGKTKCKACERLFDEAGCPDCKRKEKREIVCRTCIGDGSLPDPLKKVHCPGCSGAAFLLCTVCNGGGKIRVDKAKRLSACPACRGDGAFPCKGCGGKRHVSGAALKPSLATADDTKKIKRALDVTEKMLKELGRFQPKGGDKGRKEAKALAKILKSGAKTHPAFKGLEKQVGKYMGKIFAGKQFVGAAEHESLAMERLKASAEYYLKMQKRMLELTLKRVEANAKIAAENGGK
ncbi:MAG: hypothetical protein NXI31_25715 [bacterium]|nr:hypothetical protein [bacterium]